jgi:hypothetical protein
MTRNGTASWSTRCRRSALRLSGNLGRAAAEEPAVSSRRRFSCPRTYGRERGSRIWQKSH